MELKPNGPLQAGGPNRAGKIPVCGMELNNFLLPAGRERLLQLAGEIRTRCAKLSRPEQQQKLQAELQKAAMGNQDWQQPEDMPNPTTLPRLEVPRGAAPLSLWDWRVWTQARPSLWRYGDAGNLDPRRTVSLLAQEWIACLC